MQRKHRQARIYNLIFCSISYMIWSGTWTSRWRLWIFFFWLWPFFRLRSLLLGFWSFFRLRSLLHRFWPFFLLLWPLHQFLCRGQDISGTRYRAAARFDGVDRSGRGPPADRSEWCAPPTSWEVWMGRVSAALLVVRQGRGPVADWYTRREEGGYISGGGDWAGNWWCSLLIWEIYAIYSTSILECMSVGHNEGL